MDLVPFLMIKFSSTTIYKTHRDLHHPLSSAVAPVVLCELSDQHFLFSVVHILCIKEETIS